MDNLVQTVVCPNCGASTHNFRNCEYCGSLLVRFVYQNKAINEERYGKDAKPLPGLEDELKKHLSLQKTCGDGFAITTTPFVDIGEGLMYLFGQITPPRVRLRSGELMKLTDSEDEYGLVYGIPFQTKSVDPAIADEEKERLKIFKSIDCFFLFQPQQMPDGIRYIIDFGQDYESAARIISDYLREQNPEAPYVFNTQMLPCGKLEIDDETGFLIAPDVSQEGQKKKQVIKSLIISLVLLVLLILFYSL